MKPFAGKVAQKKHFRKWFSSYTEVKNECPEHLKMAFFIFQNCSDKVQTVFWGSKVKRSKMFEAKVSQMKHFRRWFWSCLEAKNEYSKWYFSLFGKFLSDEAVTIFWGSEGKYSKLFRSKIGHRKHFRKWFWSHFEVKNVCPQYLKIPFSTFLETFELRSWNCFLTKRGKALKNF